MEGNKTITTEIVLSSLLGQMKDHSYYIGESLKSDPNLIELGAKIQAADEHDPVLKDFINNGVVSVSNLLTRTLGNTSFAWDNTKLKVTLTTKAISNFPDGQEETLKGSIINYLSCYTLASWLKLTKPNEADRFEAMRKEQENEIMQLSAQRSKPQRQ